MEDYFNRIEEQWHERPVVTGFILGVIALMVVVSVYFLYAFLSAPSAYELENERMSEASIVYSEDGEEITRFFRENREWVPLDSIAPIAAEAVLATEDQRFYEHWGVDARRTFGAMWQTAGGDKQGGSTITMQLARNAYPELQDNFVVTRKIREWSTARHIENSFTKDEILEMYMNMMPFLHNSYGFETASEIYFQRSASEIDTLQAATLTAMLRGPTMYNPVRNPDISKQRRDLVLERLEATGSLTERELEEFRLQETEINFEEKDYQHRMAPHFAEHVRSQLRDWAEERNYDLYADGLRVHTAIDSELQFAAEEAVEERVATLQQIAGVSWSSPNVPFVTSDESAYAQNYNPETAFSHYWNANPQALEAFIRQTDRFERAVADGQSEQEVLADIQEDEAFVDSVKTSAQRVESGFVAMNPNTGHVKAWVGGIDFSVDKYDHVAQSRRQPGSTFKPFVFATALTRGYRPNDVMRDEEIRYVNQQTGQEWEPGNFGDITGDLMPLRQALAQSVNTITAQLTIEMGPERVAQQARRMGIQSDLNPVPSLGLGTSAVSLLEMTAAYSTIANNGRYQDPITVTRIEDRDGNVLEHFESEREEVMAASTAYDLLDMMRDVINEGTGAGVQAYLNGDLAGKTGTTQDNADGWFFLMHPDLVMGSWVGFNSPAVTFRTRHWGQGSRNALPITAQFAQQANLSPSAEFGAPPGWTPPSDFSPEDTLTFVDVEERLDELYEDDPDRFETDELLTRDDDSDPLDDEEAAERDEERQGPDLTDVEGQSAADSLTRAQSADLPNVNPDTVNNDNNDGGW